MQNVIIKILEKILLRLIKSRDRESFRSDLKELYLDLRERKGKVYADLWYLTQILKSIPPALGNKCFWFGIMIKSYIIVASRNFNKRRTHSILNIAGLALGISACILILQYISYESSYDKFHLDSKNIYRVQYNFFSNGEKRYASAAAVPAIGRALKDYFVEVKDYARATREFIEYSAISYDNDISFREKKVLVVTPSFLTLFSFPMIDGDPRSALKEPFTAVMTQTTARRYFGDEDAIGKKITYNGEHDFTITGICKDVPANSHLKFNILFSYNSIDDLFPFESAGIQSEVDWQWHGFYTYISLNPGTNIVSLQEKINNWIKDKRGQDWKNQNIYQEFILQPIEDIHLHSNLLKEVEPTEQGNRDAISVLSIIAVFILLLAWINYVNITTSRSMDRVKEIGIRKIAGAEIGEIVRQLFSEALLTNLFALLLAIILIVLLRNPYEQLTGIELSFKILLKSNFFLLFIGIFMLGTCLSGLYPAIVLASTQPVSILKGIIYRPGKGIIVRKILVAVQLVISIALITSTFIIFKQVAFMLHKDLGIDLEQTLVLCGPGTNSPPPAVYANNFDAFHEEILRHSQVLDLTTATSVPGEEVFMGKHFRRIEESPSKSTSIYIVGIDPNFIPLFDINLLGGRNFSDSIKSDERAVILNEAALTLLGYENYNQALNHEVVMRGMAWKVIGVISNYNQFSLKTHPMPLVYLLYNNIGFVAIKIKTQDIHYTIKTLERTWKRYFPWIPFDYFLLEDSFNRQYEDDQKFSNIFTFFSILAILIACLGIYALTSLYAVQRSKEIGIRKAVGASVYNVIMLLSKDYIKLVLYSGFMAIPISLYHMYSWLQNYAYRINVTIWFFLISWIMTLIIVIFTIGIQTYKTARANPVDALRYE
jgi:putative ABC transport system permease protein